MRRGYPSEKVEKRKLGQSSDEGRDVSSSYGIVLGEIKERTNSDLVAFQDDMSSRNHQNPGSLKILYIISHSELVLTCL